MLWQQWESFLVLLYRTLPSMCRFSCLAEWFFTICPTPYQHGRHLVGDRGEMSPPRLAVGGTISDIPPPNIFNTQLSPPPFSMQMTPMHTTVNVLSVLLKPFPSFGSLINSTSDAMSWKEPQTYLKHPFQSVMCRGMVLSFSKYSLLQR